MSNTFIPKPQPEALIETTDQVSVEDDVKVVLTDNDDKTRLLKSTQDLNEQKKLRK